MIYVSCLPFHHINLEGNLPVLYQGNSVHLSDVGFDNRNLDVQSCVELATDWVVGNWGLLDVYYSLFGLAQDLVAKLNKLFY